MGTATAVWTQEQYAPGATIRCDFTWTGAFVCNVEGWSAHYTIEDTYGNELVSKISTLGSKNDAFCDMIASAGTYTGRIEIYQNPNCNPPLLIATDTCLVQSTTNYILTLVNSPSNTYGSIELIGHGTCPTTCSYLLPAQSYSIEAHPNSGYVFSYWSTTPSGGCTSSSPTCTFNLNGNKTITAHFIVGSVNLTRSKSCANQSSYCFYGSNPPPKNTFECYENALVFSQIDSGVPLDGKTWKLEWWHSAQTTPVGTWNFPMSGGYTGWWSCVSLNPCPSLGGGTCHIKHYVDGAYIGSSNTFTYNEPPETIGSFNDADCNFYSGPFTPGQQDAAVAYMYIRNIGLANGTVYTKFFYKNSGGSWTVMPPNFSVYINAGSGIYQNYYVDLPDGIATCLPCTTGDYCCFGVAVWGEDETEPTNPSLSFMIPMRWE